MNVVMGGENVVVEEDEEDDDDLDEVDSEEGGLATARAA